MIQIGFSVERHAPISVEVWVWLPCAVWPGGLQRVHFLRLCCVPSPQGRPSMHKAGLWAGLGSSLSVVNGCQIAMAQWKPLSSAPETLRNSNRDRKKVRHSFEYSCVSKKIYKGLIASRTGSGCGVGVRVHVPGTYTYLVHTHSLIPGAALGHMFHGDARYCPAAYPNTPMVDLVSPSLWTVCLLATTFISCAGIFFVGGIWASGPPVMLALPYCFFF
jgi:hypothetical protein